MSARANRVMWILIGLILTAAGVIGALVSLGHFPGTDKNVTVITDSINARWKTWDGWAAAVIIAAGVIVAALGIALIRAELHRRAGKRLSDVVFVHNHDDQTADDGSAPNNDEAAAGRIQVSGRTLRHALQHDLQNNPRINHASVRLTGHTNQPRLHLDLEVSPEADLPTIHSYVDAALNRFRTTSQLQPTVAETKISVG